MELFQIYVTFFYTNRPSKMAASALTKKSENINQTISHELPSGFCQNMCHTDAFIEFLMLRHKTGATQHSAEFLFVKLTVHYFLCVFFFRV